MNREHLSQFATRREMMQATTAPVGGSLFAGGMPGRLLAAVRLANAQQAGAAPQDRIAQMRAQAAGATLQTLKLCDNISMISGAGGNIVALDGPDGKVFVDSSYLTVAAKLRHALDRLSGAPLKILINTHWHLDHTDGNAPLHDAGALI
jgi:hypothetical protein